MSGFSFATIKQLRQRIENKELSRQELLDAIILRFEQIDEDIRSALEIFDKESIVTRTTSEGILAGIPGLIKDNIAQEGRKLTCASNILSNYHAPYDATVIKRLKQEGAFLIGRANLDEFAMGSSTETSAFLKQEIRGTQQEFLVVQVADLPQLLLQDLCHGRWGQKQVVLCVNQQHFVASLV